MKAGKVNRKQKLRGRKRGKRREWKREQKVK